MKYPEENREPDEHKKDAKEKEDFNWFEDIAEFGFEDVEEPAVPQKWSRIIDKKIFAICLSIFCFSLFGMLFLQFFPSSLRAIHGQPIWHFFFLIAVLSFLFLITKLLVHFIFIFLRDNFSDNKLLHNKALKLELCFGLWCFIILPFGYKLERLIPWSARLFEKIFICGILTTIVFLIKNISMEMFKTHFLASSLKKKAEEVEIKSRITKYMRDFCYETTEEEEGGAFPSCFLVDCLGDDQDSERQGAEIEFAHGDIEAVVGDIFTTSIFQKKQLSQRETLSLARDIFTKCAKGGEFITFNSFCDIFPTPQSAVQAFLYFDVDNQKRIGKKNMRDTLAMFHCDMKNLRTTYNSLSNFLSVLDNLSLVVVLVPLVLIWLVVWEVPIRQIVTFSLGSALVLNIFISGIAKEFYWNASFILTHPFDVGDEVIIDGKDYTVYGTSLFQTDVLGNDGGKISFLNKVLGNKNVVNMTRAPQKLIHISFTLDPHITNDQFKSVKKDLLIYFRNKSETFYEAFTIQSETESSCRLEDLKCTLITRCRTFGNRMARLEQKIELINCLRDILRKNLQKEPKIELPPAQ